MGTKVDVDDLPFGQRLKVLRAAKGLKQTELAQLAGVHQNAVSDLELRHTAPGRPAARQAAERVERVLTGDPAE